KNNSPADGTSADTVTLHAVTADGKPAAHAAIVWTVSGNAALSSTNSVTDANGNTSRRSLAGSRYDLVDRNNEIILQYKKKATSKAVADMTLATIKITVRRMAPLPTPLRFMLSPLMASLPPMPPSSG
ncbi:Ig-like domain-containing protein, partial [Cronobacter sakazakii]|uniref:Ig-like domain-containing protein n=1 Tax=Cronobacter sakazakii TaxID=28141 RepID=UPI0018F86DD3